MFLKSLIVVLSIWQVLANNDTVLPPIDPTGLPPSNVTTTPAPSTTTNNTTTTTSTTTTTAKTTTTLAPKTTTTTAAPTPKPDNNLVINDYLGNYTDSKNVCFMAKMAIQIQLPGKDKNSSILINVPKDVNATVGCSINGTSETLLIEWGRNSVSFEFSKNESQYEIQSLSTSLLLAGSNTTTTYCHNKTEFAVPEKLSYYCVKDQKLPLTDCNGNVTVADLHLSHLHYQAFMNSPKPQYASVWNCDGANTSDVVPVVVGCVLAVLVVLVLVAYLVGRRRCQARGYLSM